MNITWNFLFILGLLTVFSTSTFAKNTGVLDLINAEPVPTDEWKQVVRIYTDNAGCTATIIGPRTIITAAHCGKSGAESLFSLNSLTYTAKLTRSPLYPGRDHDMNLGLLNKDLPEDLVPISIVSDPIKLNDTIQLMGYGCTKVGGGGGNDGILRAGTTTVKSFSSYDMVMVGGAALCFGDSGGPGFKTEAGGIRLAGVNSKGNIKDTSYDVRLDSAESQDFMKKWASDNNTEICGVTTECDGKPPAEKIEVEVVGVGKLTMELEADSLEKAFVKTHMENLGRFLKSELRKLADL